jgi:hypothetical protein
MRYDGRVGINTLNPTQMMDINGDLLCRSNLTTSNISACNITASSNFTLAGTSVFARFAPSNQLSNYALSNALASVSNWTTTQYAPSNQLSNYALLTQTDWTSNTAAWGSNNASTATNFNTFSNWVSPIAINGSNTANTDRNWTWSNSTVSTASNVSISSNQYLEFGTNINKQTDAGRIAYRRYGNSNALDIIGAGPFASSSRLVRIWDRLAVNNGTIEGQDGSGLIISGFNLGTNFFGIGHSNQFGNAGTYAIGQDLNAQTFINAASNQSVNFRINDTNRAVMNSNGVFILEKRLIISSNINVDGRCYMWSTTSAGNFALFGADNTSYLGGAGIGDASCNLIQINQNGNTTIQRGDLNIINRSSTFTIQPGMKGSTSNASWTTIDTNGGTYFWDGVEINGNMTAVSKNFTINHPLLPDKKLIHSSVEAPQYDLLYSGMATLSNGEATVNLDTDSCPFSPMTQGTFEALTTNHRWYFQNKTGWTALKGELNGTTLSIQSHTPTNDEVFWQVIAERKDTGILESITTYNGHLMTEVSP